jgi:hypothetical protein
VPSESVADVLAEMQSCGMPWGKWVDDMADRIEVAHAAEIAEWHRLADLRASEIIKRDATIAALQAEVANRAPSPAVQRVVEEMRGMLPKMDEDDRCAVRYARAVAAWIAVLEGK